MVELISTEDDMTFPLEARRRAEDILVRNKSSYYIQVFSEVSHGFAVRGDPNVPHERTCDLHLLFSDDDRLCFWTGWAKEESARGIKEWFSRFSA